MVGIHPVNQFSTVLLDFSCPIHTSKVQRIHFHFLYSYYHKTNIHRLTVPLHYSLASPSGRCATVSIMVGQSEYVHCPGLGPQQARLCLREQDGMDKVEA